jgi:DNA-binding CsgD family transcriptional regulator
MTGILLDDQRRTGPPTDEELEVMRLCASGLKDVVIARRLGVSVVTVRRRANGFRRRLGAQNRPQAVAIATRLGWITEAPPLSTDDSSMRAKSDDTGHKRKWSGGGGA